MPPLTSVGTPEPRSERQAPQARHLDRRRGSRMATSVTLMLTWPALLTNRWDNVHQDR